MQRHINSDCTRIIGNGVQGNAVSLPRLIVWTRQCRLLISANINSDTTGFGISHSDKKRFFKLSLKRPLPETEKGLKPE